MPFWLSIILKGISMGLVVSVPLGPVGIMCIQRTINRGMKSGMVTGVGAASADTLYAIIAGLGIGYIVNFIKQEKYWIQLVGAALFMIIAFRIFYANPAVEIRNQRNKRNKPLEDFLSSFIVTLSNPAVFFVFIAMFAGFNLVDEKTDYFSALLLIGGIFGGALGWWYLLSSTITRHRSKIRLKNIWWLNKIMGAIIFACGLLALYKLFF
jgi:threonine/homoserine/homoserine lactone efflux protein